MVFFFLPSAIPFVVQIRWGSLRLYRVLGLLGLFIFLFSPMFGLCCYVASFISLLCLYVVCVWCFFFSVVL